MLQWAWRGNQQKWESATRALFALLLVVALAYLIARTVWLVGYGPDDLIPRSGLRQVQGAASQQADTGLSQHQVNDWRLFGVYQATPSRQSDEVNAPETRLQLELLGLFQSRDSRRSSAIIAQQGQDAHLYHIGDDIPGNAKLENIYADRVILRRQGRLETLRLSELGSLEGVRQVARSTPPRPQPQPSSPPPAVSLAKQRDVLIRQLGLKPVTQGASEGYAIGPQAPANLIGQVGLEQGDVIVSVNGYPLGTRAADMAALQSYQDTQTAVIVVQRGDQQFTVNYPP